AKKVNKRKVPNRRAGGKSGKRARPRKESASRPLTANGSPPFASGYNGLVIQLPYDRLEQVTTSVYDGQNRLTRTEEPGAHPSLFAPALPNLEEPKQRASRKGAHAKVPKKRKTAAQKRKRG